MFEGVRAFLADARLFVIGQPFLFVIVTGSLIALISVVQEVIAYWAARLGGRSLVQRVAGRGWLHLNEERAQRAEVLFARWGIHLVIFGRILPGVGTLVSVPAGLSRMNFGLYLGATLTSAVLWNTLLVAVGYALGFNASPLGRLLFG